MTHDDPRSETSLVEERVHRLAEGMASCALGALDEARLWWCVARPDGRFDTWIVGPGDALRRVCEAEATPTADATRLSGGALVLAVHPELRVFDGEGLGASERVWVGGDWSVQRLISLPHNRLIPLASQESVPIWDMARREGVGTIDARTMGLLSFGALAEASEAVLVAGLGEPGPDWSATLWDVTRGEAVTTVRVPTPPGAEVETSATAVRPGTDELLALVTHHHGDERVTRLHRWAAGQHTVLDERRGAAPAFTELWFAAPDWLMVVGHRAEVLWDLRDLTARQGARAEQVTPSGRARLANRVVLDLRSGASWTVPGARRDPWCLHPEGDRVTVAAGATLRTWRLVG